MPAYDFDSEIDRRNSRSFKWDGTERLFGDADLLPFWVADMDFATPAPILKAIAERLQHPVLGYEERTREYVDAQASKQIGVSRLFQPRCTALPALTMMG